MEALDAASEADCRIHYSNEDIVEKEAIERLGSSLHCIDEKLDPWLEQALVNHSMLFVENVLRIDLVCESFHHGGHLLPPDGEDEEDLVGALHAVLIILDLRIHRTSHAPFYELFLRHDGIIVVCMEVYQIYFLSASLKLLDDRLGER